MTDKRTIKLETALWANVALIASAKRLIATYVAPESDRAAVIDQLLTLFDGPEQREAERLAREALGEDFGNNA
jgi:hypothetical protein